MLFRGRLAGQEQMTALTMVKGLPIERTTHHLSNSASTYLRYRALNTPSDENPSALPLERSRAAARHSAGSGCQSLMSHRVGRTALQDRREENVETRARQHKAKATSAF